MAQGRGNACAAAARAAVLLIVTVVGLCRHTASAATHTVGGAKRWDVNVDYTAWAATQTFKAGDILFFPYSAGEHNVVVVDKAGYDTCSDANAITTYIDGNTNVTLSGTGTHYYLCSVIGHCTLGMKLAVTISATATAPAPSTPPPSSPPSPSTAPASSPIQTPSTSPSPSPSTTSAPSSSAPAPGSAETPVPSSSTPVGTPTSTPVGTPTASSSAPGSTPSSVGTSPPSPNAAHSLQLSVAFASCLAMAAALLTL